MSLRFLKLAVNSGVARGGELGKFPLLWRKKFKKWPQKCIQMVKILIIFPAAPIGTAGDQFTSLTVKIDFHLQKKNKSLNIIA